MKKTAIAILVMVTMASSNKMAYAQVTSINNNETNETNKVIDNNTIMNTISTGKYIYTDQMGNELVFPTVNDYEIHEKTHRIINPRYGEEWRLVQTLASAKLYHHFIDYHSGTPNWAPASSYTISSGKNFSVNANYKWKESTLGLGFTYSYSVATTIPANPSKYSRLGVYADYTLKQEKYAEYQYGQPTGNTRISTYSKRTASYVEPVYK